VVVGAVPDENATMAATTAFRERSFVVAVGRRRLFLVLSFLFLLMKRGSVIENDEE
jgi:hypothetical protein